MSTAYPAHGTLVKAGATATPTNNVDGVKEIGIIGGEREMLDTTVLATSAVKTRVPHPLRAARGLQIKLLYDPADTQHERMRAAFEAKTLEYMTLVLPDTGAAQWAYSGYYTVFTVPTLNSDGLLECDVTFEATGAETFTQ